MASFFRSKKTAAEDTVEPLPRLSSDSKSEDPNADGVLSQGTPPSISSSQRANQLTS
jgi:hypothetical protein